MLYFGFSQRKAKNGIIPHLHRRLGIRIRCKNKAGSKFAESGAEAQTKEKQKLMESTQQAKQRKNNLRNLQSLWSEFTTSQSSLSLIKSSEVCTRSSWARTGNTRIRTRYAWKTPESRPGKAKPSGHICGKFVLKSPKARVRIYSLGPSIHLEDRWWRRFWIISSKSTTFKWWRW